MLHFLLTKQLSVIRWKIPDDRLPLFEITFPETSLLEVLETHDQRPTHILDNGLLLFFSETFAFICPCHSTSDQGPLLHYLTTKTLLLLPRDETWLGCVRLSHPSSCMLVNHGPSQQSSREKYKLWEWGATARYYTSHTKTMVSTRKSVPRSNRHWTNRRPHKHRKETQTDMVWPCLPFIRSRQNHFARHSERGKKTRRTKEEVGRQHQGMDRPGVHQVPEDSGEQLKMEATGCKIICGAPTTLAVKG